MRKSDSEGAEKKSRFVVENHFREQERVRDRICCSARRKRIEPPLMWKGWER